MQTIPFDVGVEVLRGAGAALEMHARRTARALAELDLAPPPAREPGHELALYGGYSDAPGTLPPFLARWLAGESDPPAPLCPGDR